MTARNAEFGRAVVRPLLLVAFILGQVFLFAVPKHDTLDVEVWPNKDLTPKIFQTRTVAQSFIPRINNLSRIDIFLGTYGRVLHSDLIFRLYRGGPKGRGVAEVRVPGSKIKDNLFTPIEFPPVANSGGKIFTFVLTMPDASETDGPSVWLGSGEAYARGSLFVDGRPSPGDCVFRTYSRRTILAEWERISRDLPERWNNPFILALAALIFEIAAVVVFWKVLGLFFENGEAPDA